MLEQLPLDVLLLLLDHVIRLDFFIRSSNALTVSAAAQACRPKELVRGLQATEESGHAVSVQDPCTEFRPPIRRWPVESHA